MKRIYIAGKISGLDPEYVKFNFNSAETLLRSRGFDVRNPAALGIGGDKEWASFMVKDIALLLECDAIYLMYGWEKSTGARIEHNIAKELKMAVSYESEEEMVKRHKNASKLVSDFCKIAKTVHND